MEKSRCIGVKISSKVTTPPHFFNILLFALMVLVFQMSSGSFMHAAAQGTQTASFIDYQKTFPRISDVLKRKQEALIKEFAEKGFQWPASQIYLRSFKYDSQLEVWIRYSNKEPFKLLKTFQVCALSGSMGPKRMEGDYQVPEGFYYINEFNPKSAFHLSLGLNYPNSSDRLLSDANRPGGDIYIHGSCVTTGCIPITNEQIEELYLLTAFAKNQGQDFIPVHIFPVRFNKENSVNYLNKYIQGFQSYAPFVEQLKGVYFYFEKHKKLPVIGVDAQGNYVTSVKEEDKKQPEKPVIKEYVPKKRERVNFDESTIPNSVHKLPVFPGGNEAFQGFLNQLSLDLHKFLPEKQHTAYIMVEFIIDEKGKLINPQVLKGGNPQLNDGILDRLELLPSWTAGVREGKNVPVKLRQTVVVEKPSGPAGE